MFALLLLFLTSLLVGGTLYYQNTDNINTKAYTSYNLNVDTTSQPSTWTPGTLAIANTEGGTIPSLAWAKCPSGQTLFIDPSGSAKCVSDAQLTPSGEYPPYYCRGYGSLGVGSGTTIDPYSSPILLAALHAAGFDGRGFGFYPCPNCYPYPNYLYDYTEQFNLSLAHALNRANYGWGIYPYGSPSSYYMTVVNLPLDWCSYYATPVPLPFPTLQPIAYKDCRGQRLPIPSTTQAGTPPFDNNTINRMANALIQYKNTVYNVINAVWNNGARYDRYTLYSVGADIPIPNNVLQTLRSYGYDIQSNTLRLGFIVRTTDSYGYTGLVARSLSCIGDFVTGCRPGDQYDPNRNACISMVRSCPSGTSYDSTSGKCVGNAQKAQVKVQVQ